MPKKRIHSFAAFRHNGHSDLTDMFRYDRCFPLGNAPSGWMVVCQPHIEGISGGFTEGRWSSFGVKQMFVAHSTTIALSIPDDLRRTMETVDANRRRELEESGKARTHVSESFQREMDNLMDLNKD